MDPEIKKALANIRRRKLEIRKKYGNDVDRDDGPVFGRRRALENAEIADEFDDLDGFEEYEE